MSFSYRRDVAFMANASWRLPMGQWVNEKSPFVTRKRHFVRRGKIRYCALTKCHSGERNGFSTRRISNRSQRLYRRRAMRQDQYSLPGSERSPHNRLGTAPELCSLIQAARGSQRALRGSEDNFIRPSLINESRAAATRGYAFLCSAWLRALSAHEAVGTGANRGSPRNRQLSV